MNKVELKWKKQKRKEVKGVSSIRIKTAYFQLMSDIRTDSLWGEIMQELLCHVHTPDHSHLEGLSRFRYVDLWQTLKNVIHSLLTELCGMCLRSSDIIHTVLHSCQLMSCKQQQHFKNIMHTSRNQLYNNDQHVQTSQDRSQKCCTPQIWFTWW